MYKLLVTLQVRNFQTLAEFEAQAAHVMAGYNGRIASAFETVRNEDGSGEEVHLVEFPLEEDFIRYKNDASLQSSRTA